MVALMLLALPALAAQAEVGKAAPAFTLTALDGTEVSLASLKGKTVVLEWFNPGCPYVVYAHGQGPLTDLATKTVQEDIVWLAINSGAPGKQGHGLEVNKEAAASWNMTHPILLDPTGEVGKLYGAVTTPHMFVIDGSGVLRYDGALDNAPRGQASGNVVPYLANAVKAVHAGEEVSTPRTKPYGCSVKYP